MIDAPGRFLDIVRPETTLGLKRWQNYLILFLFFSLISIPVFVNLSTPVVRLWDESRRGVNAYEMMHNHNWLVTHYNGSPEMWGTKPPLLIWIQVLFMKIIGPGELALRLPSALAAIFTCIAIMIVSARYLKNMLFGLIWALVLVTSNSYIDFHAARSGDFDALMTLFMFLYSLAFFRYIHEKRDADLYATAAFITLAVLTKGIAGLLFLPGLIIYAALTGSLILVLKNKHAYYALSIFIIVISAYYLGREVINPGYLEAVWTNELGGRYLQSLESHEQDFWFFVLRFKSPDLIKWWPYIIPGLIISLSYMEKKFRNLALFGIIMVTSHLLIISFSETRLAWYSIPEFPFLAMFIAGFIWGICCIILKVSEYFKLPFLKIVAFAFIILIFYEPSRLMAQKVFEKNEKPWNLKDHQALYILRDGLEGRRELNGYVLVNKNPRQHFLFYTYMLKDKGTDIFWKDENDLKPGDRVIAYQPEVRDFIEANYTFETLEKDLYVQIYLIR